MIMMLLLMKGRVKTLLRRQRIESLVPLWRKWWLLPEWWPLLKMMQSSLGVKPSEQWWSSLPQLENSEEENSVWHENDYNSSQVPPLGMIHSNTQDSCEDILAFQFWFTRKWRIKLEPYQFILVWPLYWPYI